MLFDKLGIARKRGGITGLGGSSFTLVDHLGMLTTDEGVNRLYSGITLPAAGFINTTTGAYVDSGASAGGTQLIDEGRPFTHYGFLLWPQYDSNFTTPQQVTPVHVGGADCSVAPYVFTTPGSVVFVAGDKRVACAAADSPIAHAQVGQIIHAYGSGPPQVRYVGRITRIISTTAFEVYPTPTTAFTANVGVDTRNASSGVRYTGSLAYVGGKVGMSYQGRIVLGNISRQDGGGANRLETFPRRFAWTSSLLEGDTRVGPTVLATGAVWLDPDGYPSNNYQDIPGQDPLTAMAPTGFGDAVFFSAYKAFRLTGNLTTQFGDDPSVTWAIREIPNSVGCMSERSLQRTPRGLIFAHASGIYSTDGASMQPLLRKRLENYWKSLQGTTFRITGSALLFGNHYYVCGFRNALTSGGATDLTEPWALLINLDTLAPTFISGKGVDTTTSSWLISGAVVDNGNPQRVWALKQNSTIGGGGHTGGFLCKLDDMFNPSAANRGDSDGQIVNFELVTAPYNEGQPSIQKDWIAATVQYNNTGGDGVGITPGFVLDSADMPAGGTTTQLPKQNVYTVTAGTGSGVIIVLTVGAGHKIAADSWVRVSGATGNTNANGLWRVQSVTATTLTLMGSIGNGAFGGTCTVQNVDQQDVSLQNAVPIGGDPSSVVYRINDTDLGVGGADLCEILAITHSWEDRDAHVE